MSHSNYCRLEIKSLDDRKVILGDDRKLSASRTTIENVFDMVKTIEEAGSQWKLMAVVNGRLVPLRWSERERTLADVGMVDSQDNDDATPYRIEVCLAWSELKKVLM